MGATSAAAGFGTKNALEAATRRRKHKQSSGAMLRPKKRLVAKIAEGASMFLPGPAPSFATTSVKLAGQAAKGISGKEETEEGDKKISYHSSAIQKMKLLRRQRPFLESSLEEANRNKRRQL